MLQFIVNHQFIRRIDNEIADNAKYLKLSFDFTDDWTDFNKLISFRCCSTVISTALHNNKVVVPFGGQKGQSLMKKSDEGYDYGFDWLKAFYYDADSTLEDQIESKVGLDVIENIEVTEWFADKSTTTFKFATDIHNKVFIDCKAVNVIFSTDASTNYTTGGGKLGKAMHMLKTIHCISIQKLKMMLTIQKTNTKEMTDYVQKT